MSFLCVICKNLSELFLCTEPVGVAAPAVELPLMSDRSCDMIEEKRCLKDITEAVTKATKDLGLVPGADFQSRVLQLSQLSSSQKTVNIFLPPASKGWGRYCFHRCLSVHTQGGVPHLHPIILPLVPCPFWGYPSIWSQVPSLGGGGYLSPRWGIPQSQVGGTLGYPLARTPPSLERMGYPPLDRTAEGVLAMRRLVRHLRFVGKSIHAVHKGQ